MLSVHSGTLPSPSLDVLLVCDPPKAPQGPPEGCPPGAASEPGRTDSQDRAARAGIGRCPALGAAAEPRSGSRRHVPSMFHSLGTIVGNHESSPSGVHHEDRVPVSPKARYWLPCRINCKLNPARRPLSSTIRAMATAIKHQAPEPSTRAKTGTCQATAPFASLPATEASQRNDRPPG